MTAGSDRFGMLVRCAIDSLDDAALALDLAGKVADHLDTPETFEYTNRWRVAAHELPTLIPRLRERLEHFAPQSGPWGPTDRIEEEATR